MDYCGFLYTQCTQCSSDTEERVSYIELHHSDESNSAVSHNGQAPLQLCLDHEDRTRENARLGLHTLMLLDIKVKAQSEEKFARYVGLFYFRVAHLTCLKNDRGK